MITRAHRFHGYNSLRNVYGRGQTVRSQLLAVKYLPNPRRSSYRAAVVVSRKVHKSAVVRGRIRRRIYEIIRLHADQMTGPYDIIITVFGEQPATMKAPDLQDMVLSLLERAGAIGGPGVSEIPRQGAVSAAPVAPAGSQQRAIVDKKESAA